MSDVLSGWSAHDRRCLAQLLPRLVEGLRTVAYRPDVAADTARQARSACDVDPGSRPRRSRFQLDGVSRDPAPCGEANGGEIMNDPGLHQITEAGPVHDEREIEAVLEVLRDGSLDLGPRVAEFERRGAEMLGKSMG